MSDPRLELILDAVTAHPQRMIARGDSMGSTIPDGSELELTPPEQFGLGDVVAAWLPDGRFVIHRVVGLACGQQILLKGDGNPRPDGWFHDAVVRARARVVSRGPERTVGGARWRRRVKAFTQQLLGSKHNRGTK